MKQVYRAGTLFLIVGIVMNLLITIALPKHEYIASTLADKPESWSIQASKVARLERYSDEVKPELVKFLRENRTPTYTKHGYLTIAALICLFFTIVGWIRESAVERRLNEQSSIKPDDCP